MTRAHCRHVCVPRWSVEGDADMGCGQLVAFLFHFRGSLLVFFIFHRLLHGPVVGTWRSGMSFIVVYEINS